MQETSDEERIKRLRRMARSLRRKHRTAEQRWLAFIEHAECAFLSVDWRGKVLTWNPAAEILLGWSQEEALGKDVTDLMVPEGLRSEHRGHWRNFLAQGRITVGHRARILPAVTKSGAEIVVELRIWSVVVNGRPEVAATLSLWDQIARRHI